MQATLSESEPRSKSSSDEGVSELETWNVERSADERREFLDRLEARLRGALGETALGLVE